MKNNEELDNIISVNLPIINNIIKPKDHKTNKYLILILYHDKTCQSSKNFNSCRNSNNCCWSVSTSNPKL